MVGLKVSFLIFNPIVANINKKIKPEYELLKSFGRKCKMFLFEYEMIIC